MKLQIARGLPATMAIASLALLGGHAVHAQGAQAFFVSPSGSDANDGRSAQSPFQTLEKARTAMRGSNVKTTYLLGGTYARSEPLKLYKEDSGTSWLGYPGQTAVLDGGGTSPMGISLTGDRITIRWLTIQNFLKTGINAWNVSNVLVDSNVIQNIECDGWNEGGIVFSKNVTNAQATHNFVRHINYAGIMYANSAGDRLTNLVFAFNSVHDTCLKIADCGALYADDVDHLGNGLVMNNNVVENFGDSSMKSKGIYLDAYLSNVTIENNIVYGEGTYALQFHGGNNNVFRNNIFDITGVSTLGLYQLHPSAKQPAGGMNGNVFTCNIVYSAKAPPPNLWGVKLGSNDAPPTVEKNLYWDKVRALPNTGAVVDASPMVADPKFEDPERGRFGSHAMPSFCSNFAPINVAQVGPVANS